jgi:hypothetical protein
MLSVRCKICNRELTSSSKTQCCGCPNMMTVRDDQVSANDLSKVVWLNYKDNLKNNNILTKNDLEYQENRRKRKVRKLNFEER